MYLPIIALVVALSGSFGVSYIAETTHPGDALYTLKTHLQHLNQDSSATNEDAMTPLDATSFYLNASTPNSSNQNATVNASTSLDPNQVINAE